MNIVEEWLSEYKDEKTKAKVQQRLSKFLEWTKKTPENLSKMTAKQAKHMILNYQRAMVAKQKKSKDGKPKTNTILGYIYSTKTFLEFCGTAMKFRRGQLLQPEAAVGYHNFSNGDLAAMFQVANVQYKALLATATSTGWGISDVLALDKNKVKSHIERAKAEGSDFVFFEAIRQKTKQRALCILNPLATMWLTKWIKQNPEPTLWNVGADMMNKMLKRLVKRADVKTTGQIKFHKIRSWLINSLVKAGFGTEQWKTIVGKKIQLSDDTYLALKDQIIEKYKEKYAEHLSITAHESKEKNTEIEQLREEITRLKLVMRGMQEIYGEEIMEKALKRLNIKRVRKIKPTPKQLDELLIKLAEMKA